MAGSVLLVEDEENLASLVRAYLEQEGYRVVWAGSGADALHTLETEPVRLVVLDLNLPDIDGLSVCKQIRARSSVPVVMLTARDEEADRLAGLDAGADDYIGKPFSPRELVARVRSVLRRSRTTGLPSTLSFPGLELDLATREVRVRDQTVELRRREFDLLAFLCSSPRQVFTREQLLRHVWDSEPEWQGIGTVSEHVHRLRAKVEVDPAKPCHILTVRGVGYRFVP
jgi:two-component system, OmpR family, phosphate regulon response regulator PhoB